MVNIFVSKQLSHEIKKRFTLFQAQEIADLIETLHTSPQKGKPLASVGGVVIKELKYGVHRFYFITDGHIIKFGTQDEFTHLIIKFVKMSDKKNQQKVIDDIKNMLRSFGFDGFA
jgi:hypothetical protein